MNRRGFTLNSTLVSMMMLSAVMTLALSLIYAAQRAERAVVRRLAETHVRVRLARDFRRDLHASQSAAAGPEAESLALRLADGREVRYRRQGQEIERVESGGGRPGRRESYSLELVRAQFDMTAPPGSAEKTIAQLRLTAPPTKAGPRQQQYLIEAALGRDVGGAGAAPEKANPAADAVRLPAQPPPAERALEAKELP